MNALVRGDLPNPFVREIDIGNISGLYTDQSDLFVVYKRNPSSYILLWIHTWNVENATRLDVYDEADILDEMRSRELYRVNLRPSALLFVEMRAINVMPNLPFRNELPRPTMKLREFGPLMVRGVLDTFPEDAKLQEFSRWIRMKMEPMDAVERAEYRNDPFQRFRAEFNIYYVSLVARINPFYRRGTYEERMHARFETLNAMK